LSLKLAQNSQNSANAQKLKPSLSCSWQRDLADFSARLQNGDFIFQDRRFQPLTHSSVSNSNVFCELVANLLHSRPALLHFDARCSRFVAVGALPRCLPDISKHSKDRLRVLRVHFRSEVVPLISTKWAECKGMDLSDQADLGGAEQDH
jgi:hypothetical protein